MKKQRFNLFIVEDNQSTGAALKDYLLKRFGVCIRISTFHDGESCLEKVNNETHIVLLNYSLAGKNGLDILKSIKAINTTTEVIMLSEHEDVALAIESFRAGAKDTVVKGVHGKS